MIVLFVVATCIGLGEFLRYGELLETLKKYHSITLMISILVVDLLRNIAKACTKKSQEGLEGLAILQIETPRNNSPELKNNSRSVPPRNP
jgi:hypothetical protein